MKKSCYIIILIFIAKLGYACDCKQFSSVEEFGFSKDVFIGKIIKVDTEMFQVEVLEKFKGSLNQIVSFKHNDCSIDPKMGERWLIYTNADGSYVSFCGWSRNLENPEESIQYMGPVLLTLEDAKREILTLKKEKATLELKLDLIKLRESKYDITSKPINSIQQMKCGLIIILLTFFILSTIYLFLKNRQLRKRSNI